MSSGGVILKACIAARSLFTTMLREKHGGGLVMLFLEVGLQFSWLFLRLNVHLSLLHIIVRVVLCLDHEKIIMMLSLLLH